MKELTLFERETIRKALDVPHGGIDKLASMASELAKSCLVDHTTIMAACVGYSCKEAAIDAMVAAAERINIETARKDIEEALEQLFNTVHFHSVVPLALSLLARLSTGRLPEVFVALNELRSSFPRQTRYAIDDWVRTRSSIEPARGDTRQ